MEYFKADDIYSYQSKLPNKSFGLETSVKIMVEIFKALNSLYQ